MLAAYEAPPGLCCISRDKLTAMFVAFSLSFLSVFLAQNNKFRVAFSGTSVFFSAATLFCWSRHFPARGKRGEKTEGSHPSNPLADGLKKMQMANRAKGTKKCPPPLIASGRKNPRLPVSAILPTNTLLLLLLPIVSLRFGAKERGRKRRRRK